MLFQAIHCLLGLDSAPFVTKADRVQDRAATSQGDKYFCGYQQARFISLSSSGLTKVKHWLPTKAFQLFKECLVAMAVCHLMSVPIDNSGKV